MKTKIPCGGKSRLLECLSGPWPDVTLLQRDRESLEWSIEDIFILQA
jgi:hypothetical protein